MGDVADETCRENQNTYFMFNNFPPENLVFYEIVRKKCGATGEATHDVICHMRLE